MTTSCLDHERGLAAFLVARRRTRFRASLEDPRLRRTLLDDLYHFEEHLDPRCATRREQHVKHDGHVDEVHALLVAEGAPATCFVLADLDLDGQEASLDEAVPALMWSGAGFLSCVPGRLGLYVGEDGSDVFVLRRTTSP